MKKNRDVIVGFTGTREELPQPQQETLMVVLHTNSETIMEAHHGDCVGADDFFAKLCRYMDQNIEIVKHPPTDPRHQANSYADITRKAYGHLTRNKHIVDESHLMIACPPSKEEFVRSGTWSTVRYARKKKVDLMLIFPDGTHSLEQHG